MTQQELLDRCKREVLIYLGSGNAATVTVIRQRISLEQEQFTLLKLALAELITEQKIERIAVDRGGEQSQLIYRRSRAVQSTGENQ
jgi:hypothetical protein